MVVVSHFVSLPFLSQDTLYWPQNTGGDTAAGSERVIHLVNATTARAVAGTAGLLAAATARGSAAGVLSCQFTSKVCTKNKNVWERVCVGDGGLLRVSGFWFVVLPPSSVPLLCFDHLSPSTALRYRPNIVLDGLPAWAEVRPPLLLSHLCLSFSIAPLPVLALPPCMRFPPVRLSVAQTQPLDRQLDWVGKMIQIGPSVILAVTEPTVRCAATCVDPATGSRHEGFHMRLGELHPQARDPPGARCGPDRTYLGLYCVVQQGGVVSPGESRPPPACL